MHGLSDFVAAQGIARPTLLLDEARARRNVARMAARAGAAGCRLRPHFKTHQSRAVGAWFREAGVRAITVSSLDMAAHFAADGWDDITVAVPLNPGEAPAAAALAARLRMGLLADHPATVTALGLALADRGATAALWIKVDTGYGRAGVAWDDPRGLAALYDAADAAPGLDPAGLLTHAGQTYAAACADEARRLFAESRDRLRTARDALAAAGRAPLPLSAGDTPGCSLAPELDGLDEIRPGNFVFFDLMQRRLGACGDEDIAVAVACPVVGRYPQRGEVVLHGGAAHLSREFLPGPRGPVFGLPARWRGDGWGGPLPGAELVALSQEHARLRVDDPELLESLVPGRMLPVLPVHSCLTADLYPDYLTLDGRRLPRRRTNDPPPA